MVGLSEADAFTAAELAARGFGADRIAVLLSVDVEAVEASLQGGPVEVEDVPAPAVPDVAALPRVRAKRAAGPSWPPPVTERTEWSVIRLPAAAVTDAGVRVRRVRLWGQDVWINGDGGVYCPGHGRFETTDELSGPFSTCPVGLRRGAYEGPRPFDVDADAAAGGGGVSEPWVDLMRVRW